MHVTILLLGEGLISTALAPKEVFSQAGSLWYMLTGKQETPFFNVITASETGDPHDAGNGLQWTPDKKIASIRNTDLIVVPAIGMELEKVIQANPKTIRWLRKSHDKGIAIAGICSGVGLLAEAGILDGRPATTHWALAESYATKYPEVDWQIERFITEQDNVFCGGGLYASVDLSLYLVEKFAGYETARQCAKALLIDSPRQWQSGYYGLLSQQEHGDERVEEAQQYLHQHYQNEINFQELAHTLGMSPRNFSRRFKNATGENPTNYLHQIRVTQAKKLLENQFMPIQKICYQVGYEDQAFFRNIFKRYTNIPPSEYRERFGRNSATALSPHPT